MSNYTKSTNFATKDNLTPGDPLKVVRGTEIDTEFNNIATAVATKTDNASAAITGGAIDGATVGATTPATGAFTTLAASGTTTLAGALVGAATQSAFNTVSTTLNLGGAATALNLGAATGTATVNNTTLAAKAITASTTLAVTGTSTLTGAVTATAGVTGPITSSSVSITGGSITGITDLAVADGGTGASTAAGGLNNLLPSQTGNANKYLQTDGTNASWDAVSLSTADITGTLAVANGGTGVTTSTGTTNVVLSNSPTLVTPALGTPSAAVLTNATGLPISTGVSGLGTGVATLLATPSSANLASAITDETGSGSLVFATSPTLVTPILGTPTSATLTNATGLPIATGVSGLGTGVATFLATPSSANLAAALTDETGSGANVFATSPTLVTPILGTPTSATLTNATGLPLTTGVTGTLPTANGGTNLTSFTSGGVVYASSTSALATGSALTFDGTNLGVTGTTATIKNTLTATTASVYSQYANTGGTLYIGKENSAGSSFGTTAYATVFYDTGNNPMVFFTSSSERMRLNSTGLGIGTSSPTLTLDVQGALPSAQVLATTGTNRVWMRVNNTGGDFYFGRENSAGSSFGVTAYSALLFSQGAYPMVFGTNSTEKMRLDSAGNLGLGVTPSAWGSSRSAIDMGANAYVGGTALSHLTNNVYFNGTNFIYKTTAATGMYQIAGAAHQWYSAASGTAGNAITFTQAMTLDASGRLGIGATSIGNEKVLISGTENSKLSIIHDLTTGQSIYSNGTAAAGTGWNHFNGVSGNGTVQNILIYGNGNIQNANNSYGSLSDSKLKENIVDATPKLEKLMQVKVRNYNLKNGYEQHKQIGVIAQELETVFPSMVDESTDRDAEGNDLGTTTKSVKYSVFVPMLIKAIQELKADFDAYKASHP